MVSLIVGQNITTRDDQVQGIQDASETTVTPNAARTEQALIRHAAIDSQVCSPRLLFLTECANAHARAGASDTAGNEGSHETASPFSVRVD